MFSILPDLTPRDSHALWYTSSRRPASYQQQLQHLDPTNPLPDTSSNNAPPNPTNPRMRLGQHAGAHAIERSALGRLRDDERTNERRRANVGNLGSTWLKPPGVAKTLFQMREERREAEEHAEAMRREMLAQELAEAEAAGPEPLDVGVGVEGGAVALGMDGDGDERMGMMEGGDDGGRDLDDDIPDADEGGFGFDGASSDDEDEEEEEEEESEVDDNGGGESGGRHLRRVHQQELQNRMATMRATEDRMREMMARGGQGPAAGRDLYGVDEDVDEEDQAHMLEEDDLVGSMYPEELEPGMDMDMDANLDDDIPEAESGGYEHTDSEVSVGSDEDTGHDISYGGMRAPQLPPPRSSIAGGPGPVSRSSMAGGGLGPRSSLDISSILSRDGSSILGSSPRLQRRG